MPNVTERDVTEGDVTERVLPYTVAGQQYAGVLLAHAADDTAARADAASREAATAVVTAAVVLLPDWRGQGPLARAHAARLVALGCVVAIADLYGDGFAPTDPAQVGPMVQRLIAHRDEGVAALVACVAALRERVAAGTPVVCLGYSAGGMIALDYGRSGAPVAGIVLCSALLKTAAPGRPSRLRAPVLILHGTQDVVSPMAVVGAVVAELDAAGSDYRVELYGQAHHAFDNPEAGSDPTARLMYSPRADRLSQRAIAEFVAEVGQGTR